MVEFQLYLLAFVCVRRQLLRSAVDCFDGLVGRLLFIALASEFLVGWLWR